MGSESRVLAKVRRGDNLLEILKEKEELRRGKHENEQPGNGHPKCREKKKKEGKRVILVCGPLGRDVRSHRERIPLERNHLSCQQVSDPRKPLLRVFCPVHRAQGAGQPS